jgi:hypothetical protein
LHIRVFTQIADQHNSINPSHTLGFSSSKV